MNPRLSTSNPQCSVELHIEELVLHGFPTAGHEGIGEAVQKELTRLLSEHGLPWSFSTIQEIERLDGGTLQLNSQSKPETIGNELARAIYGGMNQ